MALDDQMQRLTVLVLVEQHQDEIRTFLEDLCGLKQGPVKAIQPPKTTHGIVVYVHDPRHDWLARGWVGWDDNA